VGDFESALVSNHKMSSRKPNTGSNRQQTGGEIASRVESASQKENKKEYYSAGETGSS
jgi:hypothetical protein